MVARLSQFSGTSSRTFRLHQQQNQPPWRRASFARMRAFELSAISAAGAGP